MGTIEDLKGYKQRHSQIENILKAKDDSDLIGQIDEVSKENMILVVNEKKLSLKYLNVCKQQRFLFSAYCKLLKYLLQTEHFLFDKLHFCAKQNESLRIFVFEILQKISRQTVPLTEYKQME